MKYIFAIIVLLNTSLFSQTKVVKFTAVGDIMMGTNYPKDKLPPENGRNLMINVEHLLKDSDYTFGNLEGTMINGGEPQKECYDSTACYFFRMPVSYAANLKVAGFNLIGLANNHSFDFGQEGYDTTAYFLEKNDIIFSGEEGSYQIWEKDKIKFGFIAFAPNAGCNNLLDSVKTAKQIKIIADSTDILFVSFHGGAEGEDALHVADTMEVYFDENRGNVTSFAKAAIDNGADIVIGHGPHVPRALEIYKDRLIAYSLGNFCTYKGFSILKSRGLAPILKFSTNKEGKFIEGKIISARQLRSKGTILDKYNRVFKLMKKLSFEDIDSNNIEFIDDGSFFKGKNSGA